MAWENLRRSWRRASIRAAAQSEGASAADAKLLADTLYPIPGQPRPADVIIFLDDGRTIDTRDHDQP